MKWHTNPTSSLRQASLVSDASQTRLRRVANRGVPRCLGAVVAFLLALSATALGQPKDPSPEEKKAREAFAAGKLDDALKLLQTAAKADPARLPPKATLAQWCVEVGQGSQARAFIEQAIAEDPTHPGGFLVNATFALNEGRVTDVILGCNAALAVTENPRWDAAAKKQFQRDARIGLATAYEVRGDHASAKLQLTALLELDTRNAQFRQRLARANFLLDKPDDALTELRLAFKDDPTIDPPELAMAQLWGMKRDYPKAEEWYTKAVAAHPNVPRVQRGQAGFLLDRGRVEAAKVPFAAAEKLEPMSRETRALAGLFARYTKDYATATKVFEELVREYPSFGFANMNLAIVLAEAGDANGKRRATELAEAQARQNNAQPETRAVLAYCLFKAGRVADAEKLIRGGLGQGTVGPDGVYFIAVVLADRGAIEDAHKTLKLAVESKDGFVYRKEAEALLAELDKKLPPKK